MAMRLKCIESKVQQRYKLEMGETCHLGENGGVIFLRDTEPNIFLVWFQRIPVYSPK